MLAAGKSIGEVLQALERSEATLSRWRAGPCRHPPDTRGSRQLRRQGGRQLGRAAFLDQLPKGLARQVEKILRGCAHEVDGFDQARLAAASGADDDAVRPETETVMIGSKR